MYNFLICSAGEIKITQQHSRVSSIWHSVTRSRTVDDVGSISCAAGGDGGGDASGSGSNINNNSSITRNNKEVLMTNTTYIYWLSSKSNVYLLSRKIVIQLLQLSFFFLHAQV